MKNPWFHLMPYKNLPDDFREPHSSVRVDVASNLFDSARVHEHYHEYLDELEYAGEVGLEWTQDSCSSSASRKLAKKRISTPS